MKYKHTKQIEEFREKFVDGLGGLYQNDPVVEQLEQFLDEQLTKKEEETAEDICVLIDEIESRSETNTLEEWKQYKAIRNAIRDVYILKTQHKNE